MVAIVEQRVFVFVDVPDVVDLRVEGWSFGSFDPEPAAADVRTLARL